MNRFAAVQGGDQRLRQRDCSIECARVAPRFQEMSLWNVPGATRGGLIEMRAEMDAALDGFQPIAKSEVNGNVVNGIAV